MLPDAGFHVYKNVFTQAQCEELRNTIAAGSTDYKIRDVLHKNPAILEQLRQNNFSELLSPLSIVRSVFFQKPASTNWRVPWHQDVLIQVLTQKQQQINADGYTAWSQKEGIWHAQPPLELMQGIQSFRVHLSRCHKDDGALRVIPGSHQAGYHAFAGLGHFDEAGSEVIACEAGDVLAFSPLLLHSSLPVRSNQPRAVLHLEATQQELTQGLQWFYNQRL